MPIQAPITAGQIIQFGCDLSAKGPCAECMAPVWRCWKAVEHLSTRGCERLLTGAVKFQGLIRSRERHPREGLKQVLWGWTSDKGGGTFPQSSFWKDFHHFDPMYYEAFARTNSGTGVMPLNLQNCELKKHLFFINIWLQVFCYRTQNILRPLSNYRPFTHLQFIFDFKGKKTSKIQTCSC